MDNAAGAPSILEGYQHEAVFASANKISQRTVARYRNEADGLPFVEFGGRVFIPIAEAKAWLQARVKRPNPSRRKAA
jgi:hypothetical protein